MKGILKAESVILDLGQIVYVIKLRSDKKYGEAVIAIYAEDRVLANMLASSEYVEYLYDKGFIIRKHIGGVREIEIKPSGTIEVEYGGVLVEWKGYGDWLTTEDFRRWLFEKMNIEDEYQEAKRTNPSF